MFNFLADIGNYDSRRIGRYEKSDKELVSTARISDGKQPFETGIAHPDYNDGNIVIVEAYSTVEAAEEGHAKWESLMKANNLPDPLVDCCNAGIGELYSMVGGDVTYPRKKR